MEPCFFATRKHKSKGTGLGPVGQEPKLAKTGEDLPAEVVITSQDNIPIRRNVRQPSRLMQERDFFGSLANQPVPTFYICQANWREPRPKGANERAPFQDTKLLIDERPDRRRLGTINIVALEQRQKSGHCGELRARTIVADAPTDSLDQRRLRSTARRRRIGQRLPAASACDSYDCGDPQSATLEGAEPGTKACW